MPAGRRGSACCKMHRCACSCMSKRCVAQPISQVFLATRDEPAAHVDAASTRIFDCRRLPGMVVAAQEEQLLGDIAYAICRVRRRRSSDAAQPASATAASRASASASASRYSGSANGEVGVGTTIAVRAGTRQLRPRISSCTSSCNLWRTASVPERCSRLGVKPRADGGPVCADPDPARGRRARTSPDRVVFW